MIINNNDIVGIDLNNDNIGEIIYLNKLYLYAKFAVIIARIKDIMYAPKARNKVLKIAENTL